MLNFILNIKDKIKDDFRLIRAKFLVQALIKSATFLGTPGSKFKVNVSYKKWVKVFMALDMCSKPI